jgi:hypothetical protein
MWKNDSSGCYPRRDGDFQIVPRAGRATSVSRDRADHRESERGMKGINGNDQDGPSSALLMSNGGVRVDLEDVSFCDSH